MIVHSNYTSLLEAYVGKTKPIREAEAALVRLMTKLQNMKELNKNIFQRNTKGIYDLKETEDFEEAMEKAFKLKRFMLSLLPSDMGGFTVPNTLASLDEKKVKGYKKLTVPVVMGINFFLGEFTSGEVMAILIHEIGHHTQFSEMTNLAGVVGIIGNPLNAMITYMDNTFMNKILVAIDKAINFIPGARPLIDFIKKIEAILSYIAVVDYKRLLEVIGNTSYLSLAYVSAGYVMEKDSDSTATKYGYGPDLQTALQKIIKASNYKEIDAIVNYVPGLNWANDLYRLSLGILTMGIGVQPLEPVRVQHQVTQLRKELKNAHLRPEIKKQIQADLDKAEENVENYLSFTKNDANRAKIFSYVFNQAVIRAFKGKIHLRELFMSSGDKEFNS